jgi:hypothetical protein
MCQQCNAVRVNGVLCHEHGCPDAWKDETRKCRLCGDSFRPTYRNQDTCDDCRDESN